MKNIFKILFSLLLLPLAFLQSCNHDGDDWTTPDATFKLYDTTIGSDVLYPSMASNPFTLAWADVSGATSYTVELSLTDDFADPVELGTTTDNYYTTPIANLNTALLQAGFSPYSSQTVYIRIVSGSDVSSVISFPVTPYPSEVPVITSPTSGDAFVLDASTPDDVAASFAWTDYNYGTSVVYLVEVAPKGTTNFVPVGSVTNLKLLNVTHKEFNTAVLNAGLTANVAADVDVRVTATTTSTGGTLSLISEVVTISVTPYVAYKNLYLVGDATAAGWNPNYGNQPLFRDPSNTNKFYFTGYFKAGSFKLLEVLGQWQPQWGLKGGVVAVNDGTTSDPDPFAVSTAGYYTFTIDISAKTYSLVAYTGSTTTTYSLVGLIGGFNGWGGDLPLTQSSTDAHQWSATDVSLPAGELKFRADGEWTTNWGPTSALKDISGVSGQGVQGGENVPLAKDGTYDVYFNDLDGRYIFIAK